MTNDPSFLVGGNAVALPDNGEERRTKSAPRRW